MAGQQQNQTGDNSLAPLWIMILVFIVLGIVWHFFHTQIIHGIFYIKLFEIHLISYFTDGLDKTKAFILNAPDDKINFNTMLRVCEAVGDYLRYPVGVVLFVLGIMLIMRSSSFRFRLKYSMKRLAQLEVKNWPQITPVLNLNLIKKDIDKGPWAMSLTPMQFAKKNELLKEERKPLTEGMLMRSQLPTVTVMKGAAHRVFAIQLGKAWTGIDNLPIHTKTLFAVFAAKGNGDDAGARQVLDKIAISTASGNLNFVGVDRLLAKYADSKPVKQIIERHGYVLTVMATMLEFARMDGVFASADFLWLKPMDRPLWYMLNTVGRQTSLPEVAGAFSHWLTEKEVGHRIETPMVDEAVKALEIAIADIIYIPDEED